MVALSPPPKRPFWASPRVAAIPCLLAGLLWVCGGLLPVKETTLSYPGESIPANTAQVSEPHSGNLRTARKAMNLMEFCGPALAKYGFNRCEVREGGVDATIDLKRLFNALGWTVIALGCIPNAISNFTIGKNTRQPSIWFAGLTWVINFPILLLTQSVASLAFSNIALGLLVVGAANIVQNGKLKPGERHSELHMERLTNVGVLLRSFLSPQEMARTGREALAMAGFVSTDIRRIVTSFLAAATQSANYLARRRKEVPRFLSAFFTIDPDPELKRIIAGLFGLAALIAVPAMFLTAEGLFGFLSAGALTAIALQTMGIAGFFDAVTVFQQSCEFKVDPASRLERAHKKGICGAVAAKGMTDLVSFMAVSDLFLGFKFLILGGSLAEFWNKVDKDGQFEGWMEEQHQKICQVGHVAPETARALLEEIEKRASASSEWRRLKFYIGEKAAASASKHHHLVDA